MAEAARPPLPPYMPYKSLGTFFDHLRAIGIPSHIDRSVMASMSGAMQSWLKATLRYLRLIDAEDVPQPRLVKLVQAQGDERKVLLLELFNESYGFLNGKIELKNTTPQKLRAAIVELGAQGETVEKIMAFMIAMAKDAGVPLSKLLTTRAPSVRRPRPKPTVSRDTHDEPDHDDDGDENDQDAAGAAMKTITLPNSGGTLTLSGNLNLFALVGAERDLVFALIDTMRKFEEAQEETGS
jgi:hypothetical protein